MAVRAKFRLQRYETYMTQKWENGRHVGDHEVRTLVFMAVGGDTEENKQFFAATPNGEIKLHTVNEAAWSQFDLNGEYYVDFTPALERGE